MRRILCLIASAVIGLFSSFGLNIIPNEVGESTDVFCGKYDEEISQLHLTFESQMVNTLELKLKTEGEATVKIECDGKTVYERTGSEKYRFCAFNTAETGELDVSITPAAYIEEINVSYKTINSDKFRVTAYAVASTLQSPNNIDKKSFDVITDIILFGCVTFDEAGELEVDTQLLETSLENLRSASQGSGVNIYLNLLGPDADEGITDWKKQMGSKAKKHSAAFKNTELITQINAVLEKYDFDGVFFDYEFPLKQKYWNDFSSFLEKLSRSTDKKIGIAVADWNMRINKKGLKSVDMIELMQYDLFDSFGNHSSFEVCVSGVECIRKLFISPEKVDMGVPFYGRPYDASGVWLNYNEYASQLGKGNDSADTQYGKVYFNSYQTIYDKTAYSLSRGLGGMMVWHYACDITDTDNTLSLFGAMKACIDDRQKP